MSPPSSVPEFSRRSILAGAGVLAGIAALGLDALHPQAASAATVLWPNGTTVRPHISSPYGRRAAPVGGASTFHRGTDFTGYADVRSVAAGTVTIVGTPSGWSAGGVQVWIQHNGFLTRSLHLVSGSPVVHVGQTVSAGDKLGKMGATGNVSGVHHHLEVVVGGGQIDPVPYLTNLINNTPPSPAPNLEDDMIRISSPGRGSALIGPGYFRKLNTQEEIDQSLRIVSSAEAGNDRQFDLWKSMALTGQAAAS